MASNQAQPVAKGDGFVLTALEMNEICKAIHGRHAEAERQTVPEPGSADETLCRGSGKDGLVKGCGAREEGGNVRCENERAL